MVKVLNMLEKLGFVERSKTRPDPAPEIEAKTVAQPEPEPPPPEVRTIPSVEFDEKVEASTRNAENPEDFPFEKIYASAGVEDPGHGFTVFTLIEMMDAAEFDALDDQTKATVIRGLLRNLPSGEVSVDDIIDDAVQRDQALDAFERFLAGRVEKTAHDLEAENEGLQLEIDELTIRNTALIEENRTRIDDEKNRFAAWQERKQGEEDRLFEAVRPFSAENPVTREEG